MGQKEKRKSKGETQADRAAHSNRDFTDDELDKIKEKVREKLVPLHPNRPEMRRTTFGGSDKEDEAKKIADDWADSLVDAAWAAICRVRLSFLNTPKEKQKKGKKLLLDAITRGLAILDRMPDLHRQIAARNRTFRKTLEELGRDVNAVELKRQTIPEVQHAEAVAMAIAVLREFQSMGILSKAINKKKPVKKIATRAINDIGAALDIDLKWSTWVRIVIEAEATIKAEIEAHRHYEAEKWAKDAMARAERAKAKAAAKARAVSRRRREAEERAKHAERAKAKKDALTRRLATPP